MTLSQHAVSVVKNSSLATLQSLSRDARSHSYFSLPRFTSNMGKAASIAAGSLFIFSAMGQQVTQDAAPQVVPDAASQTATTPSAPVTVTGRAAPARVSGFAAAAPVESIFDSIIVSVNFSGGDLGSFLDELRNSPSERPINVVASPEVRQFTLPPIAIKESSLAAAMRAAVSIAEDPTGRARRIDIESASGRKATNGAASDIMLLTVVNTTTIAGDASATKLMVFSIADLLANDTTKAQTIISAMEVAFGELNESAKIRFHEDSQLLIVTGSARTLTAADVVLNQIRRSFSARSETQDQLATSAARMKVAEQMLMRADSEYAMANQRIKAAAADGKDAARKAEYEASAELARATLMRAREGMEAARFEHKLNEEGVNINKLNVTQGRYYASNTSTLEAKLAQLTARLAALESKLDGTTTVKGQPMLKEDQPAAESSK